MLSCGGRSQEHRAAPNNSFKPKPLRSGKTVAEKACHCFTSTTRFGLTQALDGMWKSISELTQEDLAATPVWEWKEDSGSEFVRPTLLTSLTEYRGGPVHIAATRFTNARGDVHLGYCSPGDASGLDYTQPVILTDDGPLPLSMLSASADRTLYPWRFECLVPVDGVVYADSVDAV
jgi:hypothetical protein